MQNLLGPSYKARGEGGERGGGKEEKKQWKLLNEQQLSMCVCVCVYVCVYTYIIYI